MKVTKSNLFVSTLSIWAWQLSQREARSSSFQPYVVQDEALERQKIEERLGELQRNVRCIWRAVRLMVFLTGFAVAGLGFSTLFIPDWPQTTRQFLMFWPIKAHCALGLASLSCLVAFSALGLFYRTELSGLHMEFQDLAGEISESGNRRIIPLPVEHSAPMNEAA